MPAKPFVLDRIISGSPGEHQATLPFFIAVNEVANHSSPPPCVGLGRVIHGYIVWGPAHPTSHRLYSPSTSPLPCISTPSLRPQSHKTMSRTAANGIQLGPASVNL